MIDRPVITVQRKHARTEGAGRSSTVSCELRVEGMDCASCAVTIERALENLEGVRDVSVDVVGGRVRANFPEGAVTRGQLADAVRRAGFPGRA